MDKTELSRATFHEQSNVSQRPSSEETTQASTQPELDEQIKKLKEKGELVNSLALQLEKAYLDFYKEYKAYFGLTGPGAHYQVAYETPTNINPSRFPAILMSEHSDLVRIATLGQSSLSLP
ncbi:MAG: hypothetical protein AAGF01_01080 [Cyanobacteria bacterium P01_G01_bin.38]